MSSGFISESEILEARRRRQEEWEKVRSDDQPKEAPEEPYDSRPLYLRLEEQRLKKETDYEETHKLKNMIRGLDDDEVGFLDLVEETKAKAARQISLEEQKEMQEFRERVSTLAENEEIQRLRSQLAPARTSAQPPSETHKKILQGVVIRKRKASDMDNDSKQDKGSPAPKTNGFVTRNSASVPAAGVPSPQRAVGPARVCMGVLPGLGHYDTDSSSDSDSSDNDNDQCCTKRDLLGRRSQQTEAKRKDGDKS